MKGATLLTSDEFFFKHFSSYLRGLDYTVVEEVGSIRLTSENSRPFTFYDHSTKEDDFFLKYEAPPHVIEKGLTYCYPVECGDESVFCEIVRSIPSEMNILIFDSAGELYTPRQLAPETISL